MKWRTLPIVEFAASWGFPSFSLQTKIDAKPLNGRSGSRRLHKFYQFTPRGFPNFIFLAEYKYFGLVCLYLFSWINVKNSLAPSGVAALNCEYLRHQKQKKMKDKMTKNILAGKNN